MLSPRGQTVLEAEMLSSASTSASTSSPRPRPRPRASGLSMSSDFVTWPRAYAYFTTKPKPMICIRQYVPCHPSTNLLFTAIGLPGWLLAKNVCRDDSIIIFFCMWHTCVWRLSRVYYLLYEYLLKLKKCPQPCPRPRDFVLGLGLGLVVLSSASSSGFCPRPRPQEFGLDQHHCISHSLTKSLHSLNLAILTFVNFAASVLRSWFQSSQYHCNLYSTFQTWLYCNSLYYNLPKSQIHLHQQIQNSLARAVVKAPKFTHTYHSYSQISSLA